MSSEEVLVQDGSSNVGGSGMDKSSQYGTGAIEDGMLG